MHYSERRSRSLSHVFINVLVECLRRPCHMYSNLFHVQVHVHMGVRFVFLSRCLLGTLQHDAVSRSQWLAIKSLPWGRQASIG